MRRHFAIAGLSAAGGALAALAMGAVLAYACTSLATITPSTPNGAPGSTATITGHAFDPAGSAVVLTWNSAQGPQLAQAKPDANGDISAAITIPSEATAGYFVIVASQTDKDGQPAFGTPARISFVVG